MFGKLFRKKPPSLERQLQDLAACGVRLVPNARVELLFDHFPPSAFEEQPYVLAAMCLGSLRLSENLWHLDTECIEEHGDYKRIAERFRDLAQGHLPLEEIEDFVDLDTETAWLSVKLGGTTQRYVAQVDDDWVDPEILTWFATLLADRNTGCRFTYLDAGGQHCVIGCFTPEELRRLKETTGLKWEWLR